MILGDGLIRHLRQHRRPVDVIDLDRNRRGIAQFPGGHHRPEIVVETGLIVGRGPIKGAGCGVESGTGGQILHPEADLIQIFLVQLGTGDDKADLLGFVNRLGRNSIDGRLPVDVVDRHRHRFAVNSAGAVIDQEIQDIGAGLFEARGPAKGAAGRIEGGAFRHFFGAIGQPGLIFHIGIAPLRNGKGKGSILRHFHIAQGGKIRQAIDMLHIDRYRIAGGQAGVGLLDHPENHLRIAAGLFKSRRPGKVPGSGVKGGPFRKIERLVLDQIAIRFFRFQLQGKGHIFLQV